ncbi:hypothetical protein [Desulfurispira natronophila]|uniref:Uncharacterized protein n=1 Tax=Desulfurispira natronophila TaxID=682562 RepID=A0A7W7Y2G1_9BACT|nr:hypothetical protein [Desulfurispira natronophila]MBB5020846.1 hypothetical protein [Desulfurispira natronophila]
MNTVKKNYTITASLAALAFAGAMFFSPATAEASPYRVVGAQVETETNQEATDTRFAGHQRGGNVGANFIDTTGDGVGDTRPERGTGAGARAADNFVDSTGDGYCDNFDPEAERRFDRMNQRTDREVSERRGPRGRDNTDAPGHRGGRR